MTNIVATSVNIVDDIEDSENLNNTFINFSYSSESVDSRSELIRKWYYQNNLFNDPCGNTLDNEVIGFYNVSGTFNQNVTLNSTSGMDDKIILTEYFNDGGLKKYYTSYTLKTNLYMNLTNLNFTTNLLNDRKTFVEPKINNFGGDIDCSCFNEFNEEQTFNSDVRFFKPGEIYFRGNWTLDTSNKILKQNGCIFYKKDGAKIIK